jgi:hypothetical protein
MNLLSKEVLIGAASLGAGAVAAKVVQTKVLPLAKIDNPNLQNLVTLGLGIFTPAVLKNSVGKGLGAGMIAVSVAGLVSPYLASAGIPVTGTDTFMGDVLMGNDGSNGVLMGAAETFTAPTTDFTGASSGEADY